MTAAGEDGRRRPGGRHSVVVACALGLMAASGCGGHSAPPTNRPPTTSAGSASSATAAPGKAPATIVRSWHPGGFLDGIAYSRGVLWVSDLKGDRVVRVAATTGKQLPDMAVGDGPLTVAANSDTVWVASYLGSEVTRFNARTGAKAATIRTPSLQPCGVALTPDQVWVFDQSDGAGGQTSLSGAALHPVRQPSHAGYASAGFGAVWVPDFTGSPGTLTRVDLATHATRTTGVGYKPIHALAAGDSVWVSNSTDSTITRIDPTTMVSRATIRVPGGQTGGLAYAAGLVWVASYDGNLVAAIDPATNAVVGTVRVPGSAENIAVDPRGNLWVAQSTGDLTELKTSARAGT